MGSPSASSGGGGSNRYEPPKKKNPIVEFVKGGGVAGAVVRAIKKSAAKSKTKKEANVEMGLGTDRMSNYSTSQGGTRPDGSEGAGAESILRGNIVPSGVGIVSNSGASLKAATPTIAEVSQSSETDADAETYDLRKTKKRGRSMTILKSAKGLTDDKLTLGKPSLLGS
tara:strand:- start:29 stop:535 length:507 start_codon:yes stop_codon:yes gene_type:complete